MLCKQLTYWMYILDVFGLSFYSFLLQLNGLRNALRNMFEIHGGQSLTPVMQQRISEYSLEVR